MVFRPISDEIWGISEWAQKILRLFIAQKSAGCRFLSVGHSEVTVITSKIIVAGHHTAGCFLPPQIAVALTHIQRRIVRLRQKTQLLCNPPTPALIPPSSEPGRHQPPPSHKGTKGRRRGGEQKTKPNRKKKNTGGHKEVKSLGAFTGRSWGESGSKALAFRKAPSVYVRDAGR